MKLFFMSAMFVYVLCDCECIFKLIDKIVRLNVDNRLPKGVVVSNDRVKVTHIMGIWYKAIG